MKSKLISGLFLNVFSLHFITLGLIVGAATASSEAITKATLLASIQAAASLAAMNFKRLNLGYSISRAIWFTLLIVSLLVTACLESFSLPWFGTLWLAMALGTYLNSLISAEFPSFFQDAAKANHYFQMINVVGMAAAMSAGPATISHLGIPTLLIVSALLLAIAGGLSPKSENSLGKVESTSLGTSIRGLLVLNFLIWLGLGVFNIVEVPMLVERFQGTSNLITSVFILTLGANLISIRVFASRVKSGDTWYLVASSIFLMGVSCAYLLATNLSIAVALVVLFGGANAIYNLAQYSVVFANSNTESRTGNILSIKFTTQLGILGAACIIALVKVAALPLYISLASLCVCIAGCIAIFRRLRLGAAALILVAVQFVPLKSSGESKDKKTFRVAVYSIPDKFDPASVFDISSALINRQLFHSLYRFSVNDLVPELAESHTLSNNGLRYKIRIRRVSSFATKPNSMRKMSCIR